MEGNHNGHAKLRQSTVQFMKENSADFEPFYDGEATFSDYCKFFPLCEFKIFHYLLLVMNFFFFPAIVSYVKRSHECSHTKSFEI